MKSSRITSHPLDILPLFRRVPSSPLRNLLYTGIWNALLALALVTVGRYLHPRTTSFLQDFLPALLISNIAGYLIHGSLKVGEMLLAGWLARCSRLQRMLYLSVMVMACVMTAIMIGESILRGRVPWHYLTNVSNLASLARFALVTAGFMFLVFMAGERRATRETLEAQQREQVANAAQLVAEARLRALQAQIEPHFLYNTLANVLGMIDTRPAQAKHMLERFIDYLRASLAASRADQSTLGTELDLAAAYLDVLSVRMGERLRYVLDVPDDCRDLPIAPMLLQPLIENAVSHGLEPKVDGGIITVHARREDGMLHIVVEDDGIGLRDTPPKPGGGVGLSNLRSRLRSMYGQSAQLQLIENQPAGITVRIALPLHAVRGPAIESATP